MPIARKQSHDYILDVLLALMQAISKLIHFLKKIVFIKDNKWSHDEKLISHMKT